MSFMIKLLPNYNSTFTKNTDAHPQTINRYILKNGR